MRIYVVQSFDEPLFNTLKEDENSYIISAELVLTCAEKKIVKKIEKKPEKRRKFCVSSGHSGSTSKSSIVFSTIVVSCDLFCRWNSSRNSRSKTFIEKGEEKLRIFVFRRNSAISFIISVDPFEKITVIK